MDTIEPTSSPASPGEWAYAAITVGLTLLVCVSGWLLAPYALQATQWALQQLYNGVEWVL